MNCSDFFRCLHKKLKTLRFYFIAPDFNCLRNSPKDALILVVEVKAMDPIRGSRKSESGYIMVMLVATVTLMLITLKSVWVPVTTTVQIDAEKEAIFRGQSIARALRAYNELYHTYPAHLEDLMKTKPPLLRRVYKDPLMREQDWEIITQVMPGPSGDITGLPIIGVRSKCKKDSLKVYNGKSMYSEWEFRADRDENSPAGIPNMLGPMMNPNALQPGSGILPGKGSQPVNNRPPGGQ